MVAVAEELVNIKKEFQRQLQQAVQREEKLNATHAGEVQVNAKERPKRMSSSATGTVHMHLPIDPQLSAMHMGSLHTSVQDFRKRFEKMDRRCEKAAKKIEVLLQSVVRAPERGDTMGGNA